MAFVPGMPAPQYLSDPLFPVCTNVCPTWTRDSATFVDTECLKTCSANLSLWAADDGSLSKLTDMLRAGAVANGYVTPS